jgi:hypothetical protein
MMLLLMMLTMLIKGNQRGLKKWIIACELLSEMHALVILILNLVIVFT